MTHKGTATFIAQRLTAVLLLPLVLWFIFAMTRQAGASLDEMRAFIASPLPAVMLALLFLVGAAHMRIGVNEIIDDYAHGGLKGVFKVLNFFASFGAAALGLWGVATLAL